MWQTIKKVWQAQAAIVLFLILTWWWFVQTPKAPRFFGDYPSIYGVMALWGAIWGIFISKKWGGVSSVMGKAILMFALGLLAQEFGQIVYAYLSFFLHIDVPYPSLGDVGYFGSIFFYIYGSVLLARAAGVEFTMRQMENVIIAFIIPIAMLAFSYYFFLSGYQLDMSNPIKTFLDFGYPLGQAVYISIAILTYILSRGMLGGVMKNNVLFILFALLMQYISDYTFLYQSSRGTWVVGGLNDYMYLVAYFLMTLGLMQLYTIFVSLQHKSPQNNI